MTRVKVLVVFGTRPEAIKMAPVVAALEQRADVFLPRVVVTAQHREMLDQVLDVFGITPDYDLDLMQPRQSLFDLTAAVLKSLQRVLEAERPDFVLVQGDTTTTFAGALAAFYCKVPVGHVEAGLRTYAKYAPFPEEMNRVLTTHLADLHFAPTLRAKDCLLREGVPEERVFVTGNPVVDALFFASQKPCELPSEVSRFFARHEKVLLLTTHRRESLGEPLRAVYLALRRVLARYPNVGVVFPVHKNPLVRAEVVRVLEGAERVLLLEPLPYLSFVHVMKKCYLILTDSGGIQEEAPALGKPVLVLRGVTERPEAVAAGTALLVGTDPGRLEEELCRLLEDPASYERMARAANPYGDGLAARRIVQVLAAYFGRDVFPEEFAPAPCRILRPEGE